MLRRSCCSLYLPRPRGTVLLNLRSCFFSFLPAKHPRKDERGYDGGIAFNNKFRGMDVQLAPGNLLVRYGAGVRAEGGCGIGDLAEIAPVRNIVPFQVLVHHGHYADGKVPGDAAADLE